jgi:hypothetical protein
MLKPVRDACVPHKMALEYAMGDQIENLATVIATEDAPAFFEKNYITAGMRTLFEQGLRRLAGKSDQALFELTQAMGGGKTHSMIALGLLAKHDALRQQVVPDIASNAPLKAAKIVAFTGRNYPDHYFWGEIAHQLGKEAEFTKYWQNGPAAPDEPAWMKLLGDEPVLILLDELPPYFDYALTRQVGAGNLAQVATAALSNLMAASLKLKRVCIVVANLSGTYEGASAELRKAIKDVQNEAQRQAKRITPVELASDEIYQILKKRLFTKLPGEQDIDNVAQEYAKAIGEAEKSKTIGKSAEQIAHEVRRSYPFHPSIKDIIALFKNNESYRQTRGLMQFVARMVQSVWSRPTNDVFLIGLQHLNLNNPDVREEIKRINDLSGAISSDVASNGSAHAEVIDAQMNSDAGSQVAALLLASSLSSAVDAVKGLTKQRLLEFLIAPQRNTLEFATAFDHLKAYSWYLHRDKSEAYYFSNVENLTKRLASEAEKAPQNKVDAELRRRVEVIFKPTKKAAYQEVKALPAIDDVKLSGSRVLLILSPDTKNPPEDAKRFYDLVTEKNNVCVLTGDGSDISSMEGKTRTIYAIAKVQKELPDSHANQAELAEKLEGAEQDFNATVTATFNRVLYPTKNGLTAAKLSMTFKGNDFNGEEQIETALSSIGVAKLVLDIEKDVHGLITKAEDLLWPENVKRVPWNNIRQRAASIPRWTWLPNNGLDTLRKLALQRGAWRYSDDGYIEKGPFEKPKASVSVKEIGYDDATGTATLEVAPLNAGPNAQVFWAEKNDVSAQSPRLQDSKLDTKATRLWFLAVDPSGEHQSAPAETWSNRLTITHQPQHSLGKRSVKLQVVPRGTIKYTLTGANPAEGTIYSAPISIPLTEVTLYCYAEDQCVTTKRDFIIPAFVDGGGGGSGGGGGTKVDPTRPAKLKKKLEFTDTTETFGVISKSKEMKAKLGGAQLTVGTGSHNVVLRFSDETTVPADTLEHIIQNLRQGLGDDMAPVALKLKSISFGTGQDLETFVNDHNIEVNANEVEQQ